jgi:acetyl-CoA acetyltransferase
MAVAAGLARHVLCFRTVWQSTYADILRRAGGENPYGVPRGEGRIAGEQAYSQAYGLNSAAQMIALPASYHFKRYGTTRETLGWIAINARANAALNPRAIYREPMTMDDYLSARMISTPFGLYDCDVPCDASTAVIVSAVDAARDLRKPPIRIEAIGTQWTERPLSAQSSLSHLPQSLGPASHLWSRTSLKPSDVDVGEIYDGFSFNTLSWVEALGFCGIGEAKDFFDGGKNIALHGGILPINTNGGQLSEGRTHGLGYVYEAVSQLRGEAEARQVPDVEVVVVAAGGLTPAAAMILTTTR